MTTEQDAKSKVHLRLLGRSIGLPSEAREVIEIVWKAAAEFFQAQQPMPAWMQYEPVTDVLTIQGKKYAVALFGRDGLLGDPGDLLRIEKGNDETVKVTRIPIDQQAEPLGYIHKDDLKELLSGYAVNHCNWLTVLFKHPEPDVVAIYTHPTQPVQPTGAQGEPVAFCVEFDQAQLGRPTMNRQEAEEVAALVPRKRRVVNLFREAPAAAINEETKQEILRLTNVLIDQLHRAGPAIGTNLVNVYCGRILAHLTARMADFQNFNRQVIDPVLNELEKATTKFPTWPTDPIHALAVIGEEFGELTQAVLQCTYEPHKSNGDEVRTEAIQTAAMALRFLASLDEYEYNPGEQHSQAEAANWGVS